MRALSRLVIAVTYAFTNTLAWAGCADVSGATSWSRIDTHKIIVYRGSSAIALLEMPYCYIYDGTDVRIIMDYLCNWDKIIVDREVCDIRNVERL